QQKDATNKDDIEYEAVTDDPYDLNKMWLHFYPLHGDAFMTNLNAGYGIQAQYLMKNKFNFRLQARKAYYRGSDVAFGIGQRVNDVDNKLVPFTYLEGGGAYHVIDKADAGEAKIIIYTKRYSPGKWASTVPEFVLVPAKVRKIVGVRAGGIHWKSTTNLGDALTKQKITLQSEDGTPLEQYRPVDGAVREQRIYSNVTSSAIYLGGSLGRIRNVVVKPKKYDIAVNDVIFTGYADLIYSPSIVIENVRQGGVVYSTAPVKKSPLGFRLGFEGMFNREFSWSYGAEMGVRPSIKGRSTYVSLKVGFAFASKLEQRRQAYQREQ
ncbi:MAG: hypothetical protein H7Z75_12270, partial [Ferruginibacter sp.]|nr:hypothetical protein [Cytophagales bacterium]